MVRFDLVQRTYQRQRVLGPFGVGAERLAEVAPGMTPAPDLDDVAGCVQVVEDGRGVGDEVALVAGEQAVDGLAVVLLREAVQHMTLGRDEHPEVGALALLLGQDEHPGGVGAQIWAG
jgi:hypothetical protein